MSAQVRESPSARALLGLDSEDRLVLTTIRQRLGWGGA